MKKFFVISMLFAGTTVFTSSLLSSQPEEGTVSTMDEGQRQQLKLENRAVVNSHIKTGLYLVSISTLAWLNDFTCYQSDVCFSEYRTTMVGLGLGTGAAAARSFRQAWLKHRQPVEDKLVVKKTRRD